MASNGRSRKRSRSDDSGESGSSSVTGRQQSSQRGAGHTSQAQAGSVSTGGHPVRRLQQRHGNQSVQRLVRERRGPPAEASADGTSTEAATRVDALADQVGGQSLRTTTRRSMERQFGTNFGDVRVHDGPKAHMAARALGAAAVTVGSDIFFGTSPFDPVTPQGRLLLAHELAHVEQFANADGPSRPVVAPGDSQMEREARAAALDSLTGRVGPLGATPAAGIALADESWLEEAMSGGRSLIGPARTAERIYTTMSGSSSLAMTNSVTAPLSLASNAAKLGNPRASTSEKVQGGLGTWAALSGMARMSTPLSMAGWAPGLGSTAIGSGSMTAGGAFGTTAGALSSGGALVGAGLGGYGAGRLLDNAVGFTAKNIHQGVDWATGNRRPDAQYGDHSISGAGGKLMAGADRAGIDILRQTGLLSEDQPAYKQTLGYQLAELPWF